LVRRNGEQQDRIDTPKVIAKVLGVDPVDLA
jgi:hypothetical protein